MNNNTLYAVDIEFFDLTLQLLQLNIMRSTKSRIYHSHSYYELHFCIQDQLMYTVDDIPIELANQNVLVLFPNQKHYAIGGYENTKVITVKLDIRKNGSSGQFYEQFFQSLSRCSLKTIPISSELMATVLSLKDVACRTALDFCNLKCLAYQFSYHLIFCLLSSYPYSFVDRNAHGNSINDMIVLESLINTQEYSLSQLAEMLNYSTRQLSRIIQQHYGITFRELQKRQMLENARRMLLENPHLSINQVANQVGFHNIAHFYALFREQFHCTPAEYRDSIFHKQ